MKRFITVLLAIVLLYTAVFSYLEVSARAVEVDENPDILIEDAFVPEEPEAQEEVQDEWAIPVFPEPEALEKPADEQPEEGRKSSRRRRGSHGKNKGDRPQHPAGEKPEKKPEQDKKPEKKPAPKPENRQKDDEGKDRKKSGGRRHNHVKAVKAESKGEQPKPEVKPQQPKGEAAAQKEGQQRSGNRRRRPRGKPKTDGGNKEA